MMQMADMLPQDWEIDYAVHAKSVALPVSIMADQNSKRIKSITVLNSMLDVEDFVKPVAMRPFEKPVLGDGALAMLTPLTFPLMMKTAGVVNDDVISHDE